MRTCIICQWLGEITEYAIQEHHVFGGSYRKVSEKYKFLEDICVKHHNGCSQSVHQDAELSKRLKRKWQQIFEEKHGTREEFIKIFGKSYL